MFCTGFHRRSIVALAAALSVGISGLAHEHVRAAPINLARLEVAATALRPAQRMSLLVSVQLGSIMFPMKPLPKCSVLKTSFGQPRAGGRIHQGIDLMASLGQEIYAVDNATLEKKTIDGTPDATLSGNAWRLRISDGTSPSTSTYYFYAHLSAFAPGLNEGDKVIKGQLIGLVGNTGDPGSGNYHLHFEVHPKGGAAVDPFPLLTIPKACTIVP